LIAKPRRREPCTPRGTSPRSHREPRRRDPCTSRGTSPRSHRGAPRPPRASRAGAPPLGSRCRGARAAPAPLALRASARLPRTEAFVVDVALDGGVLAADGARLVAAEFEGAEGHVHRVVLKEPSDEQVAL